MSNNTTSEFIAGSLAVTVLMLVVGLYYSCSMESAESYKKLPKFTFLIFLLIRWMKSSTMQLLGGSFTFAIPFFMYMVFYFWGSSLVSMFGFKGISAVAFLPLSVAGVVFVGTVLAGIVSSGWGFCWDYFIWVKYKGKKLMPIPDFPKMMGEMGKVVSLGLSLWGNYFAGALVLYLVDYVVSGSKSSWGMAGSWTLASLVSFPLHLYFDIIDGALHSMMFLLLTISYWMMAGTVEGKK